MPESIKYFVRFLIDEISHFTIFFIDRISKHLRINNGSRAMIFVKGCSGGNIYYTRTISITRKLCVIMI